MEKETSKKKFKLLIELNEHIAAKAWKIARDSMGQRQNAVLQTHRATLAYLDILKCIAESALRNEKLRYATPLAEKIVVICKIFKLSYKDLMRLVPGLEESPARKIRSGCYECPDTIEKVFDRLLLRLPEIEKDFLNQRIANNY